MVWASMIMSHSTKRKPLHFSAATVTSQNWVILAENQPIFVAKEHLIYQDLSNSRQVWKTLHFVALAWHNHR
jgi:hypothetical protein